jgi:CubicO group peptidase (beta-lactamase class C family)
MSTSSLPPGIRFAGFNSGYVGPRGGSTWGLGFAIRSDAAWSLVPGSVGSYTWSGAWGTYFWVDPAEQLVAVQLIQVTPERNDGRFSRTFRNLTYGAFLVPDQGVPALAAVPVDDCVAPALGQRCGQGELWTWKNGSAFMIVLLSA